MKLAYFKGERSNFGDELNAWLWPKLLPNFFDNNENIIFLGIGSILGDRFLKQFPENSKKIVFGAGHVPAYGKKPEINNSDWDIYFVRGPRTAKYLNVSPDLSLGDSAILLRTVKNMDRKYPQLVSFMPHWQSMDRGNWKKVCEVANINLIDPREEVESILDQIIRSRLVIAEAMHAAIVADALRIPWIAVTPIDPSHREKWYDWAEALGIQLRFHRLWPSSFVETGIALSRWPSLSSSIQSLGRRPSVKLVEKIGIPITAHRLEKISRHTPLLSNDKILNKVTNEMLNKLEILESRNSRDIT